MQVMHVTRAVFYDHSYFKFQVIGLMNSFRTTHVIASAAGAWQSQGTKQLGSKREIATGTSALAMTMRESCSINWNLLYCKTAGQCSPAVFFCSLLYKRPWLSYNNENPKERSF
jgi:hypothetical protein